jgi:hypothetical protein
MLPWWVFGAFVVAACAGVGLGVAAAGKHATCLDRYGAMRPLLLAAVVLLVPFGWLILLPRLIPLRVTARLWPALCASAPRPVIPEIAHRGERIV